jgi:hypothetical protein
VSSITATVDSRRAQVRLDIDLSDVNAPNVTVTRINLATGTSTVVRSYGSTTLGVPTTLVGRLVLYDAEAPMDVPLQYTAAYNSGSALVIQNRNPYFENGTITPWVGNNGAVVRSTNTQFHQGGYSMLVTPDGVSAVPQGQSEELAVTALKSYTLAGWLRTTSNATRNLAIFWFTAAHAFISGSQIANALIAGTWTQYGPTAFPAPGTAAFATLVTNDSGTPAAANTWQGDELTLSTTVNVSVTSLVVIVPSNGLGWLRDPVRPANSLALDMRIPVTANTRGQGAGVAYLGLDQQVDKANSGLFNVNNSPYPVTVSRVREAATGAVHLMARATPDVVTLKTLLAPGSSLLLQLPSAYQEDDRYLMPGDVTRAPIYNDQRRARRFFLLPFATVLAPVGPMQGTAGVRWVDLCAHTATWGSVYAAGGGTYDGFSRTVGAGSWGVADVPPVAGTAWTLAGNTADMSVAGGVGVIAISVVNTSDRAFVGSTADVEEYLSTIVPVVALGAGYQVAVLARHVDASNYYRLGIEFGLAGATLIFVTKRVAAVETVVASVAGPTYAIGQTWRIHASVVGTALKVSGWKDGTPEPVEFSVSTTDAALAAAAPYGVYARANTGNTNVLPISVQVEDFMAKGSVTWQGILDGALA